MWDATRLVSDSWNSSKDTIDCFCCSRSELHEEELRACHHYPLQIRTADVPACPVHCYHFSVYLSSILFSLDLASSHEHIPPPFFSLDQGRMWPLVLNSHPTLQDTCCASQALSLLSGWDRALLPTWKMEVPAKWGAAVLLLSKSHSWSQW